MTTVALPGPFENPPMGVASQDSRSFFFSKIESGVTVVDPPSGDVRR
jgi:hypothetical protein